MTGDLADVATAALSSEIRDRITDQVAAAVARREQRRQQRSDLAEQRAAGLRRRHARKLASNPGASVQQLTVHNAQITTATVEIKTLTIGGKQVTQAVFRQLKEESLIGNDGTLRGVPWGTVNYHPDPRCKQTGPHRDQWSHGQYCNAEHLHVVWQQGAELRRSLVWGRCDCRGDSETFTRAQQLRARTFPSLADLPQLFIAV